MEVTDDLSHGARPWPAQAVGLLAAAALYGVTDAFEPSWGAALTCTPFFSGALVALLGDARPGRSALGVAVVALMLLALREGTACLLALPWALAMTLLGALVGVAARRVVRAPDWRVVLASLFVLGAVVWQIVEGRAHMWKADADEQTTSSVTISAPVECVFEALTTGELELLPDWPWWLRLGLPLPIHQRIESSGPGAIVTISTNQGLARGEVIRWERNRSVEYAIRGFVTVDPTFHVASRPDLGNIYSLDEWLTLARVRYEVLPASDGRTQLRAQVVWAGHLAPRLYFGPLQRALMQSAQDQLLHLMGVAIPTFWSPPDPTTPSPCDRRR
jgi:hypothetical protein